MSDKTQHTAASMREKMLNRYGDELHHKHNKNHVSYRLHYKSHPCLKADGVDQEQATNGSTGLVRQLKLRKIRKRLDNGRIH